MRWPWTRWCRILMRDATLCNGLNPVLSNLRFHAFIWCSYKLCWRVEISHVDPACLIATRTLQHRRICLISVGNVVCRKACRKGVVSWSRLTQSAMSSVQVGPANNNPAEFIVLGMRTWKVFGFILSRKAFNNSRNVALKSFTCMANSKSFCMFSGDAVFRISWTMHASRTGVWHLWM